MKLDRVETGGEDRPNEVVVFLENRASRGGFGGLPFSFVYILSSLPTSLLASFRTLSRTPCLSIHFRLTTSSTLSTLSTALRSLVAAVVVGYPHLGSALNYLMSYLLGSLREPPSSGIRHAGLFVAAGDLKERGRQL